MDFKDWIKPSGEIKEWVTVEDAEKKAEITNAGLRETKYGTKLFVGVKLDGTEEKTLVLGKSLAKKLEEKYTSDLNLWKGKKGKIQNIMINVPKKGLKERPMFTPEE